MQGWKWERSTPSSRSPAGMRTGYQRPTRRPHASRFPPWEFPKREYPVHETLEGGSFFDSQRDLDAVRGYYEALGPSALPHVYVKDQVLLLQINNDLAKAEADRYGAVLQEAA